MPNPYTGNSIAARLRRIPEYQQAAQDRLSLPSWRAAVPKTGEITGAFAGAEAKKALEAKETGTARKQREAVLGLKTQGVNLAEKEAAFRNQSRWDDLGLRSREATFANTRKLMDIENFQKAQRAGSGQAQVANWLEGAGVGLAGLRGYQGIREAKKFEATGNAMIAKWKEMGKIGEDEEAWITSITDPYKRAAALSIFAAVR